MNTQEQRIAQEIKTFNILSAIVLMLLLMTLFAAQVVVAQESTSKKIVVNKIVKPSEKSKAADTSRAQKAGERGISTAAVPRPTVVDLVFPTLVNPGSEVKGKVRFRDPDDYVFSIFITVFYPDGDVVTATLYDYREEGGDIWKGTIEFFVEIPDSETPLPGTIFITTTDEYLNVTSVSKTFVQNY